VSGRPDNAAILAPAPLVLPELPLGKSGWPWTEGCAPLPDRMEDGCEWPCISVVTPSYNQARYIEETIRSVLLQGYPNLEYFVVDGGSTDGSVEVIRRYERWITWWVSERDRGQSHAINKGFARATGEVFAWLNSDDYYLPGALEAVARAWVEGDGPAVYVGRGMAVDDAGAVLSRQGRRHLDFEHLFQWGEHCLSQPSCFLPGAAFASLGGVDETLHLTMDMDLWLKLLKVAPFRHLDAFLSAAHRHPGAKTQRAAREMYVELCLVQVRHGGMKAADGYLGELFEKFEALAQKVHWFVDNPLYRCVRPILSRVLWGRTGAADGGAGSAPGTGCSEER